MILRKCRKVASEVIEILKEGVIKIIDDHLTAKIIDPTFYMMKVNEKTKQKVTGNLWQLQ